MALNKTIKADSFQVLEEKLTLAFKEIGFGILNTIDFQNTLQKKLVNTLASTSSYKSATLN